MKFKKGYVLSPEALSALCDRGARLKRGYVLSLEALSAVFLLLIAASSLALFRFPEERAQDFFACSDVAIVLSKSPAFADGSLQEKVQTASGLSGLCIEASFHDSSASACEKEAQGEKFSFSIPIWQSGTVQVAEVACWRGD